MRISATFTPSTMAIKARGLKQEGRMISNYNLQNLLLPSEFHPTGRIKVDPTTGLPIGPKNNVLYTNAKRMPSGRVREIPVNGGHAKADGSVWRVALAGPTRYIWKLMRDELAYRLRGSRSITAPTLTDEETAEARLFVAFLLATSKEGATVLPQNFLDKKTDFGMRETFAQIDEQFYKWLKKQDKTPEMPNIAAVFQFLPV